LGFFRKYGENKKLLDYIWDEQISMQLGYSFSILHAIAYTIILIQQLNLVYYYPSIYWNTAVLLVESGAVERELTEDTEINVKEKTTNYGEIAKAIGKLQSKGVKISLPYINKAEQGFLPDEENNEIVFGFKGIMKINNETSKIILENRPYKDLNDFHSRLVLVKKEVQLKTGKTQMKSLVSESQTIMLIKAGAFDKIENKPRKEILENYLKLLNPSKNKLNSKDIAKIAEMGILINELKEELRFYNFREYLLNMDKIQDKNTKTIQWYILKDKNSEANTDYANRFFLEHFSNDMEENKDYKYDDEGYLLIALGTKRSGSFESVYANKILKLTKWISTKECIETYNDILFETIKLNNMKGNVSSWEMESMNFYSEEAGHELSHVDKEKYGIVNFNDLPEEPEVIGFTKYKGLQYPKFKLDRIVGTVLDRDKNKHSVTILTPDGVIPLKFYSGQFSFYDKTISKDNGIDDKGNLKKTILENGWFQRGTLLLVTGIRKGDTFKPKRYSNSIYQHALQKIIEIKENGELVLQSDRVQTI
jgi:DNA polymerase-3 subunit alpha